MAVSIAPAHASSSFRRSLSTSAAVLERYVAPTHPIARAPPPHQPQYEIRRTESGDIIPPPLEENVRPDIPHPSYMPGQIMRLVDKPTKLPPKLAYERLDRLRKARSVGQQWNTVYGKGRKPKEYSPPPLVPVSLADRAKVWGEEGYEKAEQVEYEVGRGAETMEKRNFFVEDVEGEIGDGVDWTGTEIADEVVGLEAGRIVECRRSGQMSVGMILGSIVMSGKPRILMLQTSGEIWPISSHDIQFIMPSSLVPSSIASQCWSPTLLELWSRGEEVPSVDASDEMKSMADARRQAVAILRKISRETERMCGRMTGGVLGNGRVGGVEMVWEGLASNDDLERRGCITAAEAAEIILNPETDEVVSASTPRITVKPNTLPAYAAHRLMMRRSDLFLADQGDMWETGLFLSRSRAERQRLAEVMKLIKADTEEDQRKVTTFVDKCRAAIAESKKLHEAQSSTSGFREIEHNLPEWTAEDRSFIATLLSSLFETRSTQTSPVTPAATALLKAIEAYPGEQLDKGMYAKLMADIGVMPPWETLRRSEAKENEVRAMAMAGVTPRSDNEFLKGHELDDLREDYTSHRVFVVDDATASELDDGIALERAHGSTDAWIHVHVADPTRYIPFGHPLAEQASFRGSSIYLPEGNVPLFPTKVIMRELSLGAEVERDDGAQGVMTFSTLVAEDGTVKDSKVSMGWIKKPRVVTYSAVDEALGVSRGSSTRPFGTASKSSTARKVDATITSEDLADLQMLQERAVRIRTKRYATAGLEYSTPSSSVHLLSTPPLVSENFYDVHSLPSRPRFFTSTPEFDYSVPSHSAASSTALGATSMIAEYMILAGRTAASFAHQHNIPVPYRGSAQPRSVTLPGMQPITIDEVLAQRDALGNINPWVLAKANLHFTPGDVGLSPVQHWSMGINQPGQGYVRATSPLRRYDDMLVHWQIKSHLASSSNKSTITTSGSPLLSKETILQHVKRSDSAARGVKSSSKKAETWWQATVISSRLNGPVRDDETIDLRQGGLKGIIANGTVYSTSGSLNTTPVYLPELGVLARLPGKGRTGYEPGMEVKVKVTQTVLWPNVLIDVALD